MESTNWKFTAPQEGELDSAENKANTLQEIDDAIITPDEKAQLTGRGKPSDVIEDQTYQIDDYLSEKRGKDTWVTQQHFHPTPDSVPEADHAKDADHATEADSSKEAAKLNPGAKINNHLFDGTKDIEIKINDIPDANRVFYGTQEPAQFKGFPKELRDGDIYVKYYD